MGELTAESWDSWIILVEAAPNERAAVADGGTMRAILRDMGCDDGVALHAPDRIAVQVQVEAADVALALCDALARWRTAAAESVPQGWHVVRAEVLTLEEFRRECEVA